MPCAWSFIALGLMLMGIIMPLMYATFGKDLGSFVETIPLLAQFSNFGGGDLFSLTGMVAMGFAHPFTLAAHGHHGGRLPGSGHRRRT